MNTPNKLTIARIIATPLFLAALIIELPCHYLAALVIFVLASLTDLIDGKMARKNDMITDFGRFLDPLADKMLVTAAFLGFIKLNVCRGVVWIAFIVLMREFMITSLRLISSGKGVVISANMWGKCKTVSQMAAIIFVLFTRFASDTFDLGHAVNTAFGVCAEILLWVSAALTVISGVVYLKQNGRYIDPKK